MQLYIFWIAVIALFIGIYSIFLWKQSKRGYRFRARITIIFLLLTLIPVVPITLFLSGTLSKSLDTLISEDIEECLNSSIDVMRNELVKKGEYYLNIYLNDNFKKEEKLSLLKNEITALRKIDYDGNALSFDDVFTRDHQVISSMPEFKLSDFDDIRINEVRSQIFTFNNTDYLTIYKKENSSSVTNLIYPVPDNVSTTVGLISRNLSAYGPLFHLKETMIEENFIWAIAIIFIIVIALISILTARKLSKNITNPIFALVEGFEDVKKGNLETKVQVKAKDEIEYLIDSFNKMVEDLKLNREKLIYAEKVAAWRDVARAVSHEIKNPLTPISLSLSRIRKKIYDKSIDKDLLNECFNTIEEEIESLRRLASEFSEFARMPKPQFKKENLNDIIKNVYSIYEFNEKGIEIEIDLNEDINQVLIDKDQIKRVLSNLIKNAIDASNTNSRIIIRSCVKNNTICLEIQDFGTGINEEIKEKVFEPYFTTKSRGSGLGLSIVKRIIEEHSGEIEIHSKVDKGTTFIIKFKG